MFLLLNFNTRTMNHIHRFIHILLLISLFALAACANQEQAATDFTFGGNIQEGRFSLSDTLRLNIASKSGVAIEGIALRSSRHNAQYNAPSGNLDIALSAFKLGRHDLTIDIQYEGKSISLTKDITIMSSVLPKVYTFEIVNAYPHPINAFTQGLEFDGDTLYESTGQYGESRLKRMDYKTGQVMNEVALARNFFGEGLTIVDDRVLQLTYREGTGFIYDKTSLNRIGTFAYPQSKEGWGLCHNDEFVYLSDGTERIWRLDPGTLEVVDYIEVYHNKGKVVGINELEWVDGKIYANRWQLNGVAIINPDNGAVEGVIDFSPLKDRVLQHPGLDVLNGLAWHPIKETLFVTGKRWNTLFEVTITEK